MSWIRQQGFELPSQQVCLEESLQTVEEATSRVERLETQIREQLQYWSQAPVVKALMAHRGVSVVVATLAAGLGDSSRPAS